MVTHRAQGRETLDVYFCGNIEVAEIDDTLFEIDSSINIGWWDAIDFACKKDFALVFKLLLFIYQKQCNMSNDDDCDCNCDIRKDLDIWNLDSPVSGTSLVYEIVLWNSIQIARYLFKPSNFTNIDFNVRCGNDGDTPLITATDCGYVEMVQLLLNHPNMTKSCLNLGDQAENYTALHCTTLRNTSEIAKLLINDSRINVNVIDDNDHTPLIEAIVHESWDVVKLLLNHENIDPTVGEYTKPSLLRMKKACPQLVSQLQINN